MRRRQVLLSVPAVLGLAGCPSNGDSTEQLRSRAPATADSGDDANGTRTPTPGPTDPPPSPSVVLRTAYRRRFYADAFRFDAPDRDQFAFVRAPADAAGPPVDAFELQLGDRTFSPDRTLSEPPLMPEVEQLYGEDGSSGWLPFDLPAVDVDTAALVVDGARYGVPDERISAFGSVAEFEVRFLSAPDRVESGESIDLAVTAKNVGDRPGVFLAGFQHSGLPKLLHVRLDPGASERRTVSYEAYVDSGRMGFTFRSPGRTDDYEVVVEPPATASPHDDQRRARLRSEPDL